MIKMADENVIGLGKVVIARIGELQEECTEIRKKVSGRYECSYRLETCPAQGARGWGMYKKTCKHL